MKILLYLYPAAFRAEYGSEICHIFEQRRRRASGPLEILQLWIEAFIDALAQGTRAHWDILCQDLHSVRRTLGGSPGFAVTAMVITALGIGANTAVFTLTDHVLIRPLPFEQPDQLVKLWEHLPGYRQMEASPPNYHDWREGSTSFEAMAAYYPMAANWLGQGDPRRLEGVATTSGLFSLLRAKTHLGRFLRPEDDLEAASDTIVLSYSLWLREFGGSRDAIGRVVQLDDVTRTVIGVMPASFAFPDRATQFWVPNRLFGPGSDDRDDNYLKVLARLAPGVSLQAAHAEMAALAEELERTYPESNAKTGISVLSLSEELSTKTRLLLTALLGGSACVLLIACANLANLLLARAHRRRKEWIVRSVLGAGKERLVRQMLTESLTLALLGGFLGVGVAVLGLPLLAGLVPSSLPVAEMPRVDLRVLGFATTLTVLTALAFGVLPALRLAGGGSSGLMTSLRSGVSGKKVRLRSGLVIVEVAASVVLLISAGLLIRALVRVQALDPGFRFENVLTLQTPLPPSRYAETAERARFYDQVLTEARAVPGVESVAYTSFVPMVMTGGIWPVEMADAETEETPRRASLRFVTPDFFATLGIPLEIGRDVRPGDTEDAADVAVVSRSFTERYWPGEDPLGRSFNFAFRERRIVGVVGDIRFRGLERKSEPQVYLPHLQVPDGGLIFYIPKALIVRFTGEPAPLVPALRDIVHRVDPMLPVVDVRLLTDIVAGETASRRTQIQVLAVFSGLALLLAGIGIYGVLSFAVSQRTSEIGLRMALGARRGEILAMVLREGAQLALVGSVIGLALAYAAGRSMEALLAGIEPRDGMTFATAITLALVMTAAGSLWPAARAARVAPTEALRDD